MQNIPKKKEEYGMSFKRKISVMLVFMMVLTLGLSVNAAGKEKLSKTSISLCPTQSVTLGVTGTKKVK